MLQVLVKLLAAMIVFPMMGFDATTEQEFGEAPGVCEQYVQEFEEGDEVEGGLQPPADTSDWYGFDIGEEDVTATDAGHVLSFSEFSPIAVKWFDTDADTGVDPGEPFYLSNNPGNLSHGDVRLTAAFGYAAGTKVSSSNSDFGMAVVTPPGSPHLWDADADAIWSAGDSLFWDSDATGTITVGDLWLSDDPNHQAGDFVTSGDELLNNAGLQYEGPEELVTFHDVSADGYDIADPIYFDFDLNSVVSSLDVRASGGQYGSIVMEQTLYVVIQLLEGGEDYSLDGDLREVETTETGRHCSESTVGEPDGKSIGAKLSPYTCDPTKWSFVINQVRLGASFAPSSIHVAWSNGFQADVPLERFVGKVAHYSTSLHLLSTVSGATTRIYTEWNGQFNLERGPCTASTLLAGKSPLGSSSARVMTHVPSSCAENAEKNAAGAYTVISFQATQACTFAVEVSAVAGIAANTNGGRQEQRSCHNVGCVEYVMGFFKESEDNECADCHPPTL